MKNLILSLGLSLISSFSLADIYRLETLESENSSQESRWAKVKDSKAVDKDEEVILLLHGANIDSVEGKLSTYKPAIRELISARALPAYALGYNNSKDSTAKIKSEIKSALSIFGKIHIYAHSMGADLVVSALKEVEKDTLLQKIEKLVLISAPLKGMKGFEQNFIVNFALSGSGLSDLHAKSQFINSLGVESKLHWGFPTYIVETPVHKGHPKQKQIPLSNLLFGFYSKQNREHDTIVPVLGQEAVEVLTGDNVDDVHLVQADPDQFFHESIALEPKKFIQWLLDNVVEL